MPQEIPEQSNIPDTLSLLSEGADDAQPLDLDTKEEKVDKTPEITEEDETSDEETEDSIESTPELGEEEEESDDEEKAEQILAAPFRRKEILKKYPNLFKEYPILEQSYYRLQRFNEVFPTLEDARTAAEKVQVLDTFEGELTRGDSLNLLKTIKDSNPKGFNKLVDNYLAVLNKVDKGAAEHVWGNVIRTTILSMVNNARKSGNEDLEKAAHLINQFVFGTEDFTQPSRLSEDNPQEDEVQQQRQQFLKERFDTTLSDLQTKVDNTIKATINANIDPKNSMTAWVKKNAVNEAFDLVERTISDDKAFQSKLNGLWKMAANDKFSHNSTERIRTAYLAKARVLLPDAIKKCRVEALKALGKKASSSEKDTAPRREPIAPGRSASHSNSGDKNKPQRGESTYDFFNRD